MPIIPLAHKLAHNHKDFTSHDVLKPKALASHFILTWRTEGKPPVKHKKLDSLWPDTDAPCWVWFKRKIGTNALMHKTSYRNWSQLACQTPKKSISSFNLFNWHEQKSKWTQHYATLTNGLHVVQPHKDAYSWTASLWAKQIVSFQTESIALDVGWKLWAGWRHEEKSHWWQCLEGIQRLGINAPLSPRSLCQNKGREEGALEFVSVSVFCFFFWAL